MSLHPEQLPVEPIARHEVQIQWLQREVGAVKKDLRRLESIFRTVTKLAEIAPALIQLEQRAAALARLAEVADQIVKAVNESNEHEIFWRELRRRLSPLKPVGGLLWLVFAGIAYAVGTTLYRFVASGGHSG